MKKITSVLILLIVITLLSSCSHNETVIPSKTYVLVAGAWQGGWVWKDVQSQLEKKGQKVIVVELPAHGSDYTDPASVSISAYAVKVIAAINATKGKVILVGHSMAGMVSSTVAQNIPARIEKLIYIGAFIPGNEQSLLDLAGTDNQSLLGPSLRPSDDHQLLDVLHENIINIFCQDCQVNSKELLLAKFRPEPAMPFSNAVTLTADSFGKVDKYYIHTSLDHAISLGLQQKMVEAAGITKTYYLNSGHSPFLSMPDQVASLLLQIGAR